jgi:hypothetical protein
VLNIPDKTVAFIPLTPGNNLNRFDGDISTFLKPLNESHEREWFTANFYRCLPLSIGNMQGFAFSVPFTFTVVWDGNDGEDAIKIFAENDSDAPYDMNHVHLKSEFGHGIFTAHFPVVLKTPPGVNLMTIAAPNFPLPGISPMTGVIETDNLKFTFTLNFKIDLINSPITVKKNYPIMGILPIPRYFCDSFKLENAYDILEESAINEELDIINEHNIDRDNRNNNNLGQDKLYYRGMDIRKNKFLDHQLPRKNK